MGPRLLILGHHYQQDEVIQLSDLQGDSYQLSQMASASASAGRLRFAAFTSWPRRPTSSRTARETGGARRRARHRRAARHGRRLFDGRHGRHHAGARLLGGTRRVHRHRGHHAGHLHQQRGEPQSLLRQAWRHRLYVEQRRGVLEWAFKRKSRVSSSPINTSAATRPRRWASRWTRCASGTRTSRNGAAIRSSNLNGARFSSGKVIAVSTRCSDPSTSINSARSIPTSRFWSIRMRDGSLRQERCEGEHEQDHPNRRAISARDQVGDRDGVALGQSFEEAAPEQEIHFLSPVVCMCATMYRIDLAHLCWSLEHLAAGKRST